MKKLILFCSAVILILTFAGCADIEANKPPYADLVPELITADMDTVLSAFDMTREDITLVSAADGYQHNKPVQIMGQDYEMFLHFYDVENETDFLGITYRVRISCGEKKAAKTAIDLRDKLVSLYGPSTRPSGTSNSLSLADASAAELSSYMSENEINTRGMRWVLDDSVEDLSDELKAFYGKGCVSLKYWVDYYTTDSDDVLQLQLVYCIDHTS